MVSSSLLKPLRTACSTTDLSIAREMPVNAENACIKALHSICSISCGKLEICRNQKLLRI